MVERPLPKVEQLGENCQMDGTENVDPEEIRAQLVELRAEHRDLDDVIDRVTDELPFDQLRVKRLKKRKLALKDQISTLENMLLPDIIA